MFYVLYRNDVKRLDSSGLQQTNHAKPLGFVERESHVPTLTNAEQHELRYISRKAKKHHHHVQDLAECRWDYVYSTKWFWPSHYQEDSTLIKKIVPTSIRLRDTASKGRGRVTGLHWLQERWNEAAGYFYFLSDWQKSSSQLVHGISHTIGLTTEHQLSNLMLSSLFFFFFFFYTPLYLYRLSWEIKWTKSQHFGCNGG